MEVRNNKIIHNGQEYDGFITLNCQTHLSWKDRIKVLFGKTIHIRTQIFCEAEPGMTDSRSTTYVDDIFPRRSYRESTGTIGGEVRDGTA